MSHACLATCPMHVLRFANGRRHRIISWIASIWPMEAVPRFCLDDMHIFHDAMGCADYFAKHVMLRHLRLKANTHFIESGQML